MWISFYHIARWKYPYDAEIVHDIEGRELLQYHGDLYIKHSTRKTSICWRCPLHYTGCPITISSSIVDGRVMVSKRFADIIHTDHRGKMMKSFTIVKTEARPIDATIYD